MSSERDLKAKRHCWSHDKISDVYEYGFMDGWDQALQSEEVNKLREDNRIMREALEFYSKEENQVGSIAGPTGPWDYSAIDIDRGKIAREALEKVK